MSEGDLSSAVVPDALPEEGLDAPRRRRILRASIAPTMLTLGNLVCGFLAIAYMAIGDYERPYDLLSDAAAGTIPLDLGATIEIRDNIWSDPELETAEFRELRSRIGVWK